MSNQAQRMAELEHSLQVALEQARSYQRIALRAKREVESLQAECQSLRDRVAALEKGAPLIKVTTKAAAYTASTGETVLAACRRMHAEGIGIEAAAREIGFGCSTDMRKYFTRRGLECPWPQSDKHANLFSRKITNRDMERFAKLRDSGVPTDVAAERIGYSLQGIQEAIRNRRPDLKGRGKRANSRGKNAQPCSTVTETLAVSAAPDS